MSHHRRTRRRRRRGPSFAVRSALSGTRRTQSGDSTSSQKSQLPHCYRRRPAVRVRSHATPSCNATGLVLASRPGPTLPSAAALKREALRLPPEERARLASELLESLDELPQQDADRLWVGEAPRRVAQIDTGEVQLVSSDEVDHKARALLQLRWSSH
jgi:hypothetical protein